MKSYLRKKRRKAVYDVYVFSISVDLYLPDLSLAGDDYLFQSVYGGTIVAPLSLRGNFIKSFKCNVNIKHEFIKVKTQ